MPKRKQPEADTDAAAENDPDADIAELGEGEPGGAAGAGDRDAEKGIQLLEPDEAEAERAAAGRAAPLSTVRDQVGRFLAEARRYKRLSEEDERALGVAAR